MTQPSVEMRSEPEVWLQSPYPQILTGFLCYSNLSLNLEKNLKSGDGEQNTNFESWTAIIVDFHSTKSTSRLLGARLYLHFVCCFKPTSSSQNHSCLHLSCLKPRVPGSKTGPRTPWPGRGLRSDTWHQSQRACRAALQLEKGFTGLKELAKILRSTAKQNGHSSHFEQLTCIWVERIHF